MAVRISAPYPSTKVETVLPNPLYGDSRATEDTVQVKRSMLGRVITYVQQSPRETLQMTFLLTMDKALELEAFFRVYYRAKLKIVDKNGGVYVGNLVSPLERITIGGIKSGQKATNVTLVFSVEKQS